MIRSLALITLLMASLSGFAKPSVDTNPTVRSEFGTTFAGIYMTCSEGKKAWGWLQDAIPVRMHQLSNEAFALADHAKDKATMKKLADLDEEGRELAKFFNCITNQF